MSQTQKRRLMGVVLLLAVAIPAALAVRFYRTASRKPIAVGATLPLLMVQPVGGAPEWPNSGRRILLFFSPSCSYCEETLTQLRQLRERHSEWVTGDAALLALADQYPIITPAAFAARHFP